MPKQPLVSIVLQTFNRRRMLEDALGSARGQTYKNIEILIGDNCSEDGTESFCREQEKFDSRIKYYRHSENIGMVGNANFLLDKVTGEYFIFLNDDDWLDLDYVEKCVNYICDKPDYSMVCPSTILYQNRYSDEKTTSEKICIKTRLNSEDVLKRLTNYLINQDELEMSSGCFRTSVLRQIKKFEGQYIRDRYNEDIILEMKFLAAGKCKMLDSTHMNKREDGHSKDLNSTNSVYNANRINLKNVTHKRCKIFAKAVMRDKYFKSVLGNIRCKRLAAQIYFILAMHYSRGIFKPLKIYYRTKGFLNLCWNYFRMFN